MGVCCLLNCMEFQTIGILLLVNVLNMDMLFIKFDDQFLILLYQ